MADTLYAWAPILSADKDGNTIKVPPGTAVTAEKLNLDKEQFAQLVESRAVRTMKYPDLPDGYQDSPINYLLQQAKAAAEGTLTEAGNSAEATQAAMMANAAGSGSGVPEEE